MGNQNLKYMQTLSDVPHLLQLATAIEANFPEKSRYAIQDELRVQYQAKRKAYLFSMPVRHLYTCSTKEHRSGEIIHSLDIPNELNGFSRTAFKESELHEISEHGANFSADQRRDLDRLQKT